MLVGLWPVSSCDRHISAVGVLVSCVVHCVALTLSRLRRLDNFVGDTRYDINVLGDIFWSEGRPDLVDAWREVSALSCCELSISMSFVARRHLSAS